MMQEGRIEQCLEELGFVIIPTKGTSMWPLLKEGESQVQVAARSGTKIRIGDIVLYRRKDGTLILHRILKARAEGSYLVCGDHQWKLEEQIQEEQILGVARGFFRNGRYIAESMWWYRIYKRIWNGNLTMRRGMLAFLRLSGLEKRSLSKKR